MARKQQSKKPAAKTRSARGESPDPSWMVATEKHGAWWAAAVIALLLVVFFNPIFFANKTFTPPDQIASIAHRPYLEESFHSSGSILERYPLWTPYIFSGMPSYGSLIAAPYTNPMSILLTPIPGVFKVVAYYFLLGLFTWFFLRRHKLGWIASLVGAAAFIFCAHVATLIMFGHNSKIATLVFLPLVLLATDELWIKPSLRWTAILALAAGTMLVTSHLQVSYYTLLAAGLYMVVATIHSLRGRMSFGGVSRRWAVWIVGLLVGLAASAILFLPVREYAAHSIRGGTGGGLPYDYATNWSFNPLEITTFFVPSFLGFGGSTYWGWMPFTDFPHYMGIVTLFLAVLTLLLWPKERLHLYLLVLAVFALIVAFGRHLPVLYNLFFDYMPYFNKFRVPSMILFLLQFAVAVLAAVGLERLSRTTTDEERQRRLRLFWPLAAVFGAIVLILGMIAGGGALRDTIVRRIGERMAGMGMDPGQIGRFAAARAEDVINNAVVDVALVILFLGAGLALIWGRLTRRVPAWLLLGGVFVLVVADLWRVDAKPADYKSRTRDPHALEPTPAVEYLLQQPEPFRILPLTGQGLNNNTFAYYKIQSILGYHPAKIKIYQDLIDDRGPVGIQKTLSQGNFNVVNMLNMKYIVADQEFRAPELTTVFRSPQVVMENTTALPRMWFVDRARVIADPEAHLAALADRNWDPRAEALLFEPVPPFRPSPEGTARVTSYEPREIHADVQTPVASLLMVSEVFYEPGWNAVLDGDPVPIHRADYVLRAIEIPAGSHELVMRFDPPAFRRGVYLSLGAYSLILIGLAASIFTGRKRKGSGAAPADETAGAGSSSPDPADTKD